MHELGVTQGMLDVALEAASRARAPRIIAIDLVIGELTSIVDDSVQFYFDILSRETVAAGAQLRFRREPARAQCLDCSHARSVAPPLEPACEACGSLALRVTGGQEFYVESIEVDDEGTGGNGDPESE